ncbi:ABC transporter ATP-binding protein [Microscilla marina]|uniref:ABC transporter, ATP-binding protein n=1 Tax=Microscilla marina ATCC 23134 TaxID=313606 RepID=A1ZNX0_MICM2|nr:ABC transporter ATP-binding protein [Microscilla marina]EAY28009.1 ABC transporter, ATP-binding protein [Microscilla marina ATCC 23134]
MLEAKNLSKKYGDKVAVHQLNLAINPGEIFCLLGANGAGKTTTINLFLNFITPTEGQVSIKGINVAKQPLETKKHLAYIPENLMLYANLSGLENLAYFSGLAGKKFSKAQLIGFLQEAGLQDAAHKQRVQKYSKGMRQKVGIAIALAKNAEVLLLDEPTSGLDPKASNEFAKLLQKLKEQKVATLMATHDLFRAKETGTHVGIMKEGQLVEHLTTQEINHSDLEKLYLQHMN